MAKLSAHGRKELVRLYKEKFQPDDITCVFCNNEENKVKSCLHCNHTGKQENRTIYSCTTIALMSDGKILEKYDVRFRPTPYEKSPQHHTYGWKVKGKVKENVTVEQFVAVYIKAGFVRE